MEKSVTPPPPPVNFGRQQLQFLFIFMTMMFVTGSSNSIQAPLYPLEATKKGVAASVYGSVLGIVYLPSVIFIPIISIYMMSLEPLLLLKGKIGSSNFDVRSCLVFIYFFGTVCVYSYGLLDFIDSTSWFIFLSFALRILNGFAASAPSVNYTAICLVFPNRIATIVGLSDALWYGSAAIGPILGEMLYAVGGYIVACLGCGSAMLCASIALLLWLPEIPKARDAHEHASLSTLALPVKLLQLCKIPRFFLHFVTTCVTMFATGYISTNLGTYVLQFNLGPAGTGFMFTLMGLPLVSSPGWGFVCDRTGRGEEISILGFLIATVGITFIGPVSFVPIKPTALTTGLGLFLFGAGQGALIGSIFHNLIQASRKRDPLVGAVGIVGTSVFYALASTIGNLLGPTISGVMFDAFGFKKSLVLLWICYAFLALLLLIVAVFKKSNNLDLGATEVLPDERKPLLTHSLPQPQVLAAGPIPAQNE